MYTCVTGFFEITSKGDAIRVSQVYDVVSSGKHVHGCAALSSTLFDWLFNMLNVVDVDVDVDVDVTVSLSGSPRHP